jgi:hypothetical protein
LGDSSAISPDTFERIQGLSRKVNDSKDFVEGRGHFKKKEKPKFIREKKKSPNWGLLLNN